MLHWEESIPSAQVIKKKKLRVLNVREVVRSK